MNSTGRTIAKNAGFMMASQVITWGLALAVTILLPRYLGAANIGRYQLASSLWAVMAIIIGFGMDTLLTKEIARDPARTSALFFVSVILRIVIFVAGFILMVVYAQLVGYPQETKSVIYIIGAAILIGQIGSACRAVLQGLERMEFMSLGDIAGKAFLTILAIILLLKGYGLVPIASLEIGSAFVSLAVLYFALRRIHVLKFKFDRRLLGGMLKTSFPFLLLSGFMVAYSQIDVIVVSLLVSEQQVGWYSAAIRLSGTFVFIPTVFMAALLPASSRMHQSAPEELRRLMSKSLDLLLLVCVPIGLGVMTISKPLVQFLYGPEFVNSGPILAVMGIVVIFFSLNMLIGQFFISSDRQSIWVIVMAVATVATIPLDLLLVPWCERIFGIGALGGALSYVATESSMLVFGLVMLPRGVLTGKNAWVGVRVVSAGIAMAAAVWPLRELFIAIPIAVGIAVYLSLILLFRVVSPEDWVVFKSLAKSAFGRLRRAKAQPVNTSEMTI